MNGDQRLAGSESSYLFFISVSAFNFFSQLRFRALMTNGVRATEDCAIARLVSTKEPMPPLKPSVGGC